MNAPWIARLKEQARRLKGEVLALVLAARHPRTPWYAKLFLAAIWAHDSFAHERAREMTHIGRPGILLMVRRVMIEPRVSFRSLA